MAARAVAVGATDLSAFVPDYLIMNVGTNEGEMLKADSVGSEAIYHGVLKKLPATWRLGF